MSGPFFKKFFSCSLHLELSFPSLHSSQSLPHLPPPPWSITPPFSFWKEQSSHQYQPKHGIASYNETRHMPSSHGWTRQSNRRERIPHWGKSVRAPSTLTVRSTKEHQANNPCMQRTNSQLYRVRVGCFNSYETLWALPSWLWGLHSCRECASGRNPVYVVRHLNVALLCLSVSSVLRVSKIHRAWLLL